MVGCSFQVLTSESGEDAECHAAKLLEVLLLQYKGQIDNVSQVFCLPHITLGLCENFGVACIGSSGLIFSCR